MSQPTIKTNFDKCRCQKFQMCDLLLRRLPSALSPLKGITPKFLQLLAVKKFLF